MHVDHSENALSTVQEIAGLTVALDGAFDQGTLCIILRGPGFMVDASRMKLSDALRAVARAGLRYREAHP